MNKTITAPVGQETKHTPTSLIKIGTREYKTSQGKTFLIIFPEGKEGSEGDEVGEIWDPNAAALIVRAVNHFEEIKNCLEWIASRASSAPHDDANLANQEFTKIMHKARALLAKLNQ